jgi:hypothetical protein
MPLDTNRSVRNVRDKLPEKLRSVVASRMRRAYHADSALAAEAELTALAAELDRAHPGAAASLREGALLRWGGGSRLLAMEGTVQMARASSVKIASSRRPGSVACPSS